MSWLIVLATTAWAQVSADCQVPKPDDYDEIVQQDFLQNYPALALTFSPIHAPIPHEPGRGAIGMDFAVIPGLPCEKRMVLEWSKEEDASFSPIAPRISGSFAFPAIADRVIPYAGLAYLPPIPMFNQRTSLLSVEAGVGWRLKPEHPLQMSVRFHATSTKLIANVARAFRVPGEEPQEFDDYYNASSFGFDAIGGWELPWFTPFLAVGYTDVSTFFYIGDDGVVTNNYHPYSGFTFSAGLDGLVANRFRWGAEFYGAPGGYHRPDKDVTTSKGAPAYGHMYTARFRLAYEL